MDYDVVFVDDERNAVKDHRTNRPSSGGWRPRPASGTRTVVVPPGARPTVITGGSSASGYYRPTFAPTYPPYESSFAARFGMTMGELIDSGLQILTALQPLPSAPTAQGEPSVDVENLMTYQGALWQHAKRDEQWRTLGGLLARILK
jgi:hypothetical protein